MYEIGIVVKVNIRLVMYDPSVHSSLLRLRNNPMIVSSFLFFIDSKRFFSNLETTTHILSYKSIEVHSGYMLINTIHYTQDIPNILYILYRTYSPLI